MALTELMRSRKLPTLLLRGSQALGVLPSPPRPAGPMSCMSWLWLMFPSRLCRPPSPAGQKVLRLGLRWPGASSWVCPHPSAATKVLGAAPISADPELCAECLLPGASAIGLEPFLIRKSQGKSGFLKAQLQYLSAFAKLIKALAQNQFIYRAPGMGWKERLGRDTPALRLNANTLPPVTQGLAL